MSLESEDTALKTGKRQRIFALGLIHEVQTFRANCLAQIVNGKFTHFLLPCYQKLKESQPLRNCSIILWTPSLKFRKIHRL
jgi:hypothetical protein